MFPGCCFEDRGDRGWRWNRLLLLLLAFPSLTLGALPSRLVVALDGIPYRDMVALQEGITYTNLHRRTFHRQAFQHGYFPASRLVSTFPSASDVAWTEILGNRPLPGYQRTYFCQAANLQVAQNGVTTTMEYEREMTWQVPGGFLRGLGYVFPRRTFKYEVHELFKNFLKATNCGDTYYALIRTTDDAQHLSADILALLDYFDGKLEKLRSVYRAREGRELEIILLSDHANNDAGPAKRVQIKPFLKKAGYRVSKSIQGPKDVVLPTAGIESWIEIHNSPSETENLMQRLWHLEGVDVLTGRNPDQPNQFIVMNRAGERALIDWNPARNAFRYTPTSGDPINYLPVVESLSRSNLLDADGFAAADAWMAATVAHRYPLALERILRGHTHAALNPATILISLDNAYVHSGWFVKFGSEFVRFGGTHGALDDLNSTGFLMTNFAPTPDTSANRVAALFDGFDGTRNYRAEENGAELLSERAQALAAIARPPPARSHLKPSGDGVFLCVWTPAFTHLEAESPVEVTIRKRGQFLGGKNHPTNPCQPSRLHLTLTTPIIPPDNGSPERIYALPPGLTLEPEETYLISGRVRDGKRSRSLFRFEFQTDAHGRPTAY